MWKYWFAPNLSEIDEIYSFNTHWLKTHRTPGTVEERNIAYGNAQN